MIWREKERFRVKVVQTDNLRVLLGIRKIDRVPNIWIRQLCGMKKEMDKKCMKVFSNDLAMKNDWIAKSAYIGECTGSRSIGRPSKRWILIL